MNVFKGHPESNQSNTTDNISILTVEYKVTHEWDTHKNGIEEKGKDGKLGRIVHPPGSTNIPDKDTEEGYSEELPLATGMICHIKQR